MKLYCKGGRVLADHSDDQNVPASAYGEGVLVVPYHGSLGELSRIGDAPSSGPDTRPYAAPPLDLAAVKSSLAAEIDREAEAIRSRIATPGAGQAMEYKEAQDQAAAALKAPSSATAEKYPMLAASIGIDIDPQTAAPATEVLGVARAVMAAYQGWQTIGAGIRKARLAGKAAIDAASTEQEAADAYAAVIWPTLN